MTPSEFEQECQPSDAEIALRELARRYHADCEAYDRTVCTGPIRHGSVMPAHFREAYLVGRNASQVRRRLALQAHALGFTDAEFAREIGRLS